MSHILEEHRGFWGQIARLAKNELIKTYKGAVIGPLWAVVKPSFTLFVYWFAFALGFKEAGNVKVAINDTTVIFDRFIFMLAGFVPWFFMQDSIIFGMKSIRANRHFVTKISFPVSTIMSYTLLSKLYVHMFLSAIMLVIIGGVLGLSWYALQLLLLMPLMFMYLNPINFFANSYRKAVLYNQFFWNNTTELLIFGVEFVLVFILGVYNYNRLRKRIPDVL